MLATCICLNGSLLDQLSCTIVYLHNLFTCTFGRINMSVCLSVSLSVCLSVCLSRFEFTDGLSLKLGQVRSRHNLKPSGTPIEFVTELSLHYAGRV